MPAKMNEYLHNRLGYMPEFSSKSIENNPNSRYYCKQLEREPTIHCASNFNWNTCRWRAVIFSQLFIDVDVMRSCRWRISGSVPLHEPCVNVVFAFQECHRIKRLTHNAYENYLYRHERTPWVGYYKYKWSQARTVCACSKIDDPLKPNPNERMRDFGLEIDSVLVCGALAVAKATVTAEYSDAYVDTYVYEYVFIMVWPDFTECWQWHGHTIIISSIHTYRRIEKERKRELPLAIFICSLRPQNIRELAKKNEMTHGMNLLICYFVFDF